MPVASSECSFVVAWSPTIVPDYAYGSDLQLPTCIAQRVPGEGTLAQRTDSSSDDDSFIEFDWDAVFPFPRHDCVETISDCLSDPVDIGDPMLQWELEFAAPADESDNDDPNNATIDPQPDLHSQHAHQQQHQQ